MGTDFALLVLPAGLLTDWFEKKWPEAAAADFKWQKQKIQKVKMTRKNLRISELLLVTLAAKFKCIKLEGDQVIFI